MRTIQLYGADIGEATTAARSVLILLSDGADNNTPSLPPRNAELLTRVCGSTNALASKTGIVGMEVIRT
jgi:hypothetical protein